MNIRLISLKSAALWTVILATAALGGGCATTTGDPSAAAAGDKIFDETTNGKVLVSAAMDEAKAGNKNVILLFGANWCPYCRQLHALIENDAEVHTLVGKKFVVVPIDVGTSSHNRNLNLIDKYGATVFTDGTPSVVIVDPSGKRLAPTKDNPWSAKNPIEAGRVMRFLNQAGG